MGCGSRAIGSSTTVVDDAEGAAEGDAELCADSSVCVSVSGSGSRIASECSAAGLLSGCVAVGEFAVVRAICLSVHRSKHDTKILASFCGPHLCDCDSATLNKKKKTIE